MTNLLYTIREKVDSKKSKIIHKFFEGTSIDEVRDKLSEMEDDKAHKIGDRSLFINYEAQVIRRLNMGKHDFKIQCFRAKRNKPIDGLFLVLKKSIDKNRGD